MKSQVVLDFKRIIAEVAARHGMLVSQDDPAMLLVTMNEVVLQQVFTNIEARTEGIVAGLEAGFRLAQTAAVGRVSREARRDGTAVRAGSLKDIVAMGKHAMELIFVL